VPVQTQLDGPGRIAAHFAEQRAEIGIVNVEIVVIDVDRLVTREPELPVDLLALEGLRHADEHDPVADLPFPAEIVGNIISF